MGETIGGAVSAEGSKTSVVVEVTGYTSAKCVEELKLLLKNWAKRCGVSLAVKVKKKKKTG